MPRPARLLSGVTQDPNTSALGDSGFPNPFFYHLFEDDFDWFGPSGTKWTVTANANGTVALTPLDGGNLLFTTNSSTPLATDIAQIQLNAASFLFVPATNTVAGKRTFFVARVQLSSATNAAMILGLCNTSSNIFTGTTDGVYFFKASGGTTFVLRSSVGGVNTDLAIPAPANAVANATVVDLGFQFTGTAGNTGFPGLLAYVNWGVGFNPQNGQHTNQYIGPVARMQNPSLTTATLNVSAGINSGTAASSTMTLDFILAARER